MINPAVFIGEPIDFKNICKIYPPKIKDVVANLKFGAYLRLFTMSQEDFVDEIRDKKIPGAETLTLFEFLLDSCKQSKEFHDVAVQAFEYFTHEKVMFLYDQKAILIGDLQQEQLLSIDSLRLITKDNFFDFQNVIRVSVGLEEQKPEPPPNPNEDPRITKMKQKIRERDRAKAKKAAEGKADGINLATSLTAICCMGLGLTPLTIGEMSYAAVPPLMKMMQNKEKYELDIHSLLAGADSKKVKPKYWIRNYEQE